MPEGTRRRRNAPTDSSVGRRRRRGAPPPDQGRRRRRGETAGDSGKDAEETPAPAPDKAGDPPPGPTRSTPVATEVTLPQLGESVTEGTITAWLVEVGDSVEADQPLFELSSDKIDTEVPAPAAGVLTEIKVQVDETVDVGTVVAIIGEGDGAGGDGQASAETAEEDQAEQADDDADRDSGGDGGDAPAAGTVEEREEVAEESVEEDTEEPEAQAAPDRSADAGDGQRGALTSPLVRRLAAENDVDLKSVKGTGDGGRITREDVEAAIGGATRQPAGTEAEKPAAKQAAPERKEDAKPKEGAQPKRRPAADGARTRVEDLSRIRQRIAAKMMESLESSAQLTTVQEVDITQVMALRARVKEEFKQREGVSLSPFVFLCRAAVIAIRNHERINAQADWNAGRVTFHDAVNLGIAVDTEKGLLVPNVKGADDLSLAGLARAISDVANRARGKGKLEMQDIEGGTFTVTNTGSVDVLIDTPILNYPEVAILGTGAVKKRPVVVDTDGGAAIAIRDMLYLSLTYDHRLIDGADAARFVTEVKQIVETHDWGAEIGY
ncbi:MAG: 2-oxoglutarate dehydrogenase, E2 component, dihydrolipoamide succinyltransferase [Nitriliruptorales bacterium]|nr:2-oxoglutarate dehydrogenase, E2 component, dihydrolipoamide succinyltransferase [Nitriliruptorales bacterium]